jgi:uncharacterized caspase-like protein
MARVANLAGIVIASLVWALICQPAVADKRVALVLGNSNYLRAPKLTNPENDAEDLAGVLRGLNFEVIFKTDVDRRGLDLALEEFERRAQGADTAMFFFAGHGLQHRGRNYLVPIDADLEDEVSLRYNTLALDRVRDALDAASGVKIMVLDACRNNPLADKLVSGTGGASRSVEVTRGLARLDRAEGMVVAYATQADRVAQDGIGRNSPFSAALVRRLQEPNLEIATLFRRVAQDVFEQTGGRQRPELSISLLQDFYLNVRDEDARVWRSIVTTATEQELQDFIARFPSSPYARDAQSRLFVHQTLRAEREAFSKRVAAFEAEREAFERREREAAQAEKRDREITERENADLGRLKSAMRQEAQDQLSKAESPAWDTRNQGEARPAAMGAGPTTGANDLREAARNQIATVIAQREVAARVERRARKRQERQALRDQVAALAAQNRADANRDQSRVQPGHGETSGPIWPSVSPDQLAEDPRSTQAAEAARKQAARIVAERELALREREEARKEEEARREVKRKSLREEVAAIAAQRKQLAALEEAATTTTPACRREAELLAHIKQKEVEPARRAAELRVLRATLTCDAVRPAVTAAITALQETPVTTFE